MGIAVVAGGVLAVVSLPARPDPVRARAELAQSLALLARGNASGARAHAHLATQRDPSWGLAHAVLARTMLVLGDGAAAQGELTRAVDTGFDPARAHQLVAHADLLQGDPGQALVEAARAPRRYAGYAARVTALALAAQGKTADAQRRLIARIDASHGRDAEAWADLASVQFGIGDLGNAAIAADRALALDHHLVRALVLRAGLVRDQYGLAAALPWYRAALKVDPADHDALVGYAATLGDAGQYRAMLAATRAALVARPDSAQVLYLQAVLAARAGNVDLAQSLANRVTGGFATLAGPQMLLAMLDFAGGGGQQAVARLRWIVAIQPQNADARRLLGAVLARSGDWSGALDVLRPLAQRADADSYSLALAGRALEASGERAQAGFFLDRAASAAFGQATALRGDDALDALRARAESAPGDVGAIAGYARGLIDAGQRDQALAVAQRLASADPGVPAAQLLLGDVLMVMGRAGDAAMAYARAADLRFDEPTLLRMVDANDRAGQHIKSAAALALFLSQNPQNVAAERLAAHWQVAAGDWTAAIAALERLRARLGNGDAALLAELAAAYAGNGDLDAAQLYAAKAYDIAPLNPAVVDCYGWVLYQAGADDPARQLLEKAVAIAPGHTGLRWHLAQVQADIGQADAARANLHLVLADPAFPNRDAAQAVLKLLG